jgi:hypothetical protein
MMIISSEDSVHSSMKQLFRDIRSATARNIKPGLILQSFGIALVLSYYLLPQTRPVFDSVMHAKERFGFLYSALSTLLFGALLPLAILYIMKRVSRISIMKRIAALIVFWVWKGIEVDILYRSQAFLFGAQPDTLTVIKKVCFDQFVYNPFWAAPSMLLWYLWIDAGFSFKRVKEVTGISFFTRTLPTVLVSTWVVWIPATEIVYSLPVGLQLPVFNLVLCFWVLIFDLVSKSGVKEKNNE